MADSRTETARPWKTTKVMARILESYPMTRSVLDFGCGKYCKQVGMLRDAGFDIDGYDIWFEDRQSVLSGIYSSQNLPPRCYDIVACSNVINIQRTPDELRETLLEASSYVAPGGTILFNYPSDPRKMGWEPLRMRKYLQQVLGGQIKVDRGVWMWQG